MCAATGRAQSAAATQTITLGHSADALTGPWKFHPGDSPASGSGFLWAQPGFSDAGWYSMNLTPAAGSTDPAYGFGGYLPGWTAYGFSSTLRFAWYRLRIHLSDRSQPVSLLMPGHVDDAYQVYANGRYLGSLGHFLPGEVLSIRSEPLVFRLPAPDAQGDIVLAIRFFLDPSDALEGNTPDVGGMHQTPVAGLPAAIAALQSQELREKATTWTFEVFESLFYLFIAIGAAWLWLLNRRETVYLWLSLGLGFSILWVSIQITEIFAGRPPQDFGDHLIDFFLMAGACCWCLFWWRWFRLGRSRFILPAVCCIFVLDLFANAALAWIPWHLNGPTAWIRPLDLFDLTCLLLLGLILLTVGALGFRKDRVESLVALPPLLLLVVAIMQTPLLQQLHIRTDFFPFGVSVAVGDVAMLLMVLIIGALAARRFVTGRVEERLARQAINQELEQARILQQQVLVPEPIRSPYFQVEAEYRPAQTVGGDFYQLIPREDGSLLIVLGDVSGKGIGAAMLVAVLVGAIRSCADQQLSALEILEVLNRRLLGRASTHFATCLAAEIHPDGRLTLVNAGHLPPYLDGKALPIGGSLPLGLVEQTSLETLTLQLEPGARLTFLTDGVVEAHDAGSSANLFGFERAAAISRQPARAIAESAAEYGQQDDITVIGLTLAGEPQPA